MAPAIPLQRAPLAAPNTAAPSRQIQPFSHSKGPRGLPPIPSSGLYQKALKSRREMFGSFNVYKWATCLAAWCFGEVDEGRCRCNLKLSCWQGVRAWHGLSLSRRGSVLGSVWSADAPAIRMIAAVPRCCWSRSVQRAYISVK